MDETTTELAPEGLTLEVTVDVVLLAVICLGSLGTNGLVIFVVTCRESFHTATYFYYLSLAAADLILGGFVHNQGDTVNNYS